MLSLVSNPWQHLNPAHMDVYYTMLVLHLSKETLEK